MLFMFTTFTRRYAIALGFIVCSPVCFGQDLEQTASLPSHAIPFIAGELTVDGELNETQWQRARVISLDIVTSPYENTEAPVATEVRIFENGETLYVGFIATEPDMSQLRAFYRDRDQVWRDDIVGLELDTFNDRRLAYEFYSNPFGVQIDAILNEMTSDESDSWDAIWQSAGKLLANGYQIEMAIPLNILNFNESLDDKTWAAAFVRYRPREDRLRISNVANDRNNACGLCQLGEITGFKHAKQGENLAIVPSLVLGQGRSRSLGDEQDQSWQTERNQQLSLDVKWGITPEVSVQATLNPDFSQVEADAAQLSINNTFALFFNEKRPFFLENADYFSSNFDLVYTRNINAPDYGSKITGRVDQHTFGVFVANDESTTFIVPGNVGSSVAQLDQPSTNLALRYRYDMSDELALGIISTVRDANGYHNYVYGIDSKYQFSPQDTLRVQLLRSDTLYPDTLFQSLCADECTRAEDYSEAALRVNKDEAFSDTGYRISYDHEERNWNVRGLSQQRGADFRTDLGFGSQADFTQNVIGGGYNWYSETHWWNQIRVSGDWDITHNDAGELLEKEGEIYLGINGQRQSYIEFGYLQRDRVGLRFDPSSLAIKDNTTLFHEQFLTFYSNVQATRALAFEVFVRMGDEIDFSNNQLGKVKQFQPSVNWSIGQHLSLQFDHVYKKLDVDNGTLFTANLSDARLTYQFDQRQFIRFIAIYSDIKRDPSLYAFEVDAQSKELGTQLLYSYKINPLTKFFVGYSDVAMQDDTLTDLTRSEQSIFMKFSYAWLN